MLLLLPIDNFKLLMHWKGPFEILERVHGNDYRIQLTDKTRLFHANLLKKYYERMKEANEESEVHELSAAVVEPVEGSESQLPSLRTYRPRHTRTLLLVLNLVQLGVRIQDVCRSSIGIFLRTFLRLRRWVSI